MPRKLPPPPEYVSPFSTEVIYREPPEITRARAPFVGLWRIQEMSNWDAEYFDMEVPAHVNLGETGGGYFQFGLVQGDIDWRCGERDGQPAIEFSWLGQDECDPASGRGRARVGRDGKLTGLIVIHHGDQSTFEAVKQAAPTKARRARTGTRKPRRS